MAEVTVYDAVRMKAIEDGTVVNGEIDPVTGHLTLIRFNATEIDAGLVNVSPRVVTSGTRPVAPNVFEGLQIYETDTDRMYTYNGAQWVPRGYGIHICTAATRPPAAGLPSGVHIYETDTKNTYVWDGTNWLATGSSMPHTSSVKVNPAGGTTTSATFVALNVSLGIGAFPKLRGDTKIIARYDGAIFNDAALGAYEIAISVAGTDYVIGGGFSSTGNKSGVVEVPAGIAAGNIVIAVRKRRANATGNVSDGDVGARNCLTVTETF